MSNIKIILNTWATICHLNKIIYTMLNNPVPFTFEVDVPDLRLETLQRVAAEHIIKTTGYRFFHPEDYKELPILIGHCYNKE